jgi:hypothetical protein
MSYASDHAASRSSRDRDLLPAGPRLGPYEHRYDTRRGYQQPFRGVPDGPASLSSGDVVLFRAHEDEGRREG